MLHNHDANQIVQNKIKQSFHTDLTQRVPDQRVTMTETVSHALSSAEIL